MNDDVQRQILRQFSKEELLVIVDELEIDIKPFARAPKLIVAINDDLDKNGIPEEDETSALLERYLIAAGYVDDDNEVIEEEEDEEEVEPERIELPVVLPECYSLADIRDPACMRCSVFDACHEERIARRPACFGKWFSETADECAICIESPACRQLSIK